MHAYNPSTPVAETGGSGVQCQPGLQENVSKINKLEKVKFAVYTRPLF